MSRTSEQMESTSDKYTRFHDETSNTRRGTSSSRVHDSTHLSPNEDGEFDSVFQQDLTTNDVELAGLNQNAENYHYWEMTYHEAAVFLEEGENNDKFDFHPRNPAALPAYLVVHSAWYNGLDLAAALLLLFLGFVEPPAVPLFQLPIGVHGAIELIALIIIGIELGMKLRWLGWKAILKHKRTAIKGVTLVIMVIEACVVLLRQSSHFRVTRAFRPIFVLDNRGCGGIRRFIRQVLQSLPPIMDMLGLLMLLVALYSLLGFFLFGAEKEDPYFMTLPQSFVNLFVLLTTANYPDVMMPAYSKSKWNSIFFISYLSIALYLLMNLLLAVVYEAFTSIEKEKFRKLLLHRREAARRAFHLLSHGDILTFQHFAGAVRYFRPKMSLRDTLLAYKVLDSTGRGRLELCEFLGVYEAVSLRWQPREDATPWFTLPTTAHPIRFLGEAARYLHDSQYFEKFVYTLIVGNALAMIVRILQTSSDLEHSAVLLCASWDSLLFLGLFTLEACIRTCALGVRGYFSSGWNIYDFGATLAAVLALVVVSFHPELISLAMIRPLRLLRMFKLKKRFRDVFGTVFLLLPLMSSAAVVLILLYYFFAIIGMELFAGYEMRNCCVNSTVEAYYRDEATGGVSLYYLNSFSDLLSSSVVLFELTVVNNWHVTMEGYAVASGSPWSRLYFMLFYLVTMVVLTIVVASILEAFRFRIQYKEQTTKKEERRMLCEETVLHWEELTLWAPHLNPAQFANQLGLDLTTGGSMRFIGVRSRTTEVLQRRMFHKEIALWMAIAEEQDELTAHNRCLLDTWSSHSRSSAGMPSP